MKELVEKISKLNQEEKTIESQIEALKQSLKKVQEENNEAKLELLAEVKDTESFKQSNSYDQSFGDSFVTYFRKENTGYKDEAAVLNYLKEHNLKDLITVKTTESLNKNNIKKELKTNNELKEALDSMIVTNVIEYVTVTNKENHELMLEHIESKK